MRNNTITGPKEFLSAGVHCGIKKFGKFDLGLIVCPTGAKTAAVFTTNKITSAAVQISKQHIKSPSISAVVVNSGNANACTGQQGINNAINMCSKTAQYLSDIQNKRLLRFARNDEKDAIRDTQHERFSLLRRALSVSSCQSKKSSPAFQRQQQSSQLLLQRVWILQRR